MAELTERRGLERAQVGTGAAGANHQAFRILHLGFVVAPTLAGLDKFAHLMTNWNAYVAPQFVQLFGGYWFMYLVGAIEVAAGLLVALKPRIGAYVVAGWLGAIIVNLVILSITTAGLYYDIALRDLGLMLGALALGRLATAHERGMHRPERTTAAV